MACLGSCHYAPAAKATACQILSNQSLSKMRRMTVSGPCLWQLETLSGSGHWQLTIGTSHLLLVCHNHNATTTTAATFQRSVELPTTLPHLLLTSHSKTYHHCVSRREARAGKAPALLGRHSGSDNTSDSPCRQVDLHRPEREARQTKPSIGRTCVEP